MKPTESQIQKTIDLIDDKLDHPFLESLVNANVKEGYTEALAILVEDRRNYEGIDALNSVQSRAIAVLAVDYLNGECTQAVLTGIPLQGVEIFWQHAGGSIGGWVLLDTWDDTIQWVKKQYVEEPTFKAWAWDYSCSINEAKYIKSSDMERLTLDSTHRTKEDWLHYHLKEA